MRFYRPLGPVKAMTFDLDDTLYDNGPVIRVAEVSLQDYIVKHYPRTAQLTPAQWQDIRHRLLQADPRLSSDMGRWRLQTLQQALASDIDDETTLNKAAKACFDCFYTARSNFVLTDEMHQTMAKLARRVPLIGITNGNVDTQTTGLNRYFSKVLHASVERPMKPARAMFDEAVALLNVPAHEVLHVGDNLEKDVYGAIAAGLQSAWYAHNRGMVMRQEQVKVLPHIELRHLEELVTLL